MTRFIDYKQLISQKTGKYPFLISNTENSTKDGEHWWSILDTEPKKELFFYLFGVDRLKNFIITDNKKTVQKILSGIEKMTQKDNKITLVKIKFSIKACKNLSNKEVENLSHNAWDFFHFIQSFGGFSKVKDFLDIWMVDNPLQMTQIVTCSLFQLYFYENLFNPNKSSKIQNNK